jgi:small multidrug resistance pump
MFMGKDHRMNYHYLIITIIAEVVATSALKSTDEFTRLIPSLIVIIGYAVAFYFFTLALRTLPVGVAYALWAGLGIVLVALVTAIFYRQIPDTPAVLGITLIVSGVVVIQLFSETASH